MKIVLATIHAKPAFTPLALLYLKAYLIERAGFASNEVVVKEFLPHTPAGQVTAEILRENPDLIGFSCYVWNVSTLLEASRDIKGENPRIKIIFGGPEVGPVSIRTLENNPAIDAVVKSEGEIPFSEIALAVRDNRDFSHVKGIAFRHNDTICESENAPILHDLNHLPSPHKPEYGDFENRFICLETQRGCVFRCNFCFYNKDFSIRNRRFDLDRIKAELLYWLKQDVKSIYLMDPIFNLHAERAKEICSFIIKHNRRKIAIHTEIWAEFVDDEMARLFKEAGFGFLEVGLQTTEESVLATVERRLKVEKFRQGLAHLKKYKLNYELQIIFGLPGDTLDSYRRSLDFAAALEPNRLAVYSLMILPGTELWRKAEALQLRYDPKPFYRLIESPTLSSADIAYGRRLGDVAQMLSQSKAIRLLADEVEMTFSQMADEFLSWYEDAPTKRLNEMGTQEIVALLSQFTSDFCRAQGLQANFYLVFLAREYPTKEALVSQWNNLQARNISSP